MISNVPGPWAPFPSGECPRGQAPAGVTRDCRDLLWEGLLALLGQWPVLKSWEGMRERGVSKLSPAANIPPGETKRKWQRRRQVDRRTGSEEV